MNDWKNIEPTVNSVNEFLEIATDFGDPLEVLREAISNAYDAEASEVKIEFSVDGNDKLVIVIEDDGKGMAREVLESNFWDLGNSTSRNNPKLIGEKGHGTKIYLRSEKVHVKTFGDSGGYESVCENPFSVLRSGKMHEPKTREIPKEKPKGTIIRLEGYNRNDMSRYKRNIVVDYIHWFTKHGSFENQFPDIKNKGVKLFLKCLDTEVTEEIPFGHPFATENKDIQKLFDAYKEDSVDYYVKKFMWEEALEKYPHIRIQTVIYVEGDKAKRLYNPLIKGKKSDGKGYYKVADRYGIWLAKDFIPVQMKNEWITGFGQGSNAFVMLHGFVNCQKFALTANRGSVANTDPDVIDEVQRTVKKYIQEIDDELTKNEINTLKTWQDENRTRELERVDYNQRIKSIKERKRAVLAEKNKTILEPKNESELFGLLMYLYAIHPEIFEFEPLDYNTTRGIDIIGRNTNDKVSVSESEFKYVELKYTLSKNFNHSFENTRWIVCWDFNPEIKDGSEIESGVETKARQLKIVPTSDGKKYFLDEHTAIAKISVIRLKELLFDKLKLEFK